MFRNSPVLCAVYRSYRVEVRMLHAPQGLLSELKLFHVHDAHQTLVLCERSTFSDEQEATKTLACQICRYVDDLIERNAAA